MNPIVKNKRIKIDLLSLERITNWVKIAKGEVSGLGLVEDRGEDFFISHVFLLKQRCTNYGTELEESSIAELMLDLEKHNIDSGQLRFWWHSHGSTGVFWSDTDNATVERLANKNFFISAVFNKEGRVKSRIDLFEPVRITLDDADFSLEFPQSSYKDEYLKEFEEKVIEGKPKKSKESPGMSKVTHSPMTNETPLGLHVFPDDYFPDDYSEDDYRNFIDEDYDECYETTSVIDCMRDCSEEECPYKSYHVCYFQKAEEGKLCEECLIEECPYHPIKLLEKFKLGELPLNEYCQAKAKWSKHDK